MKQIKNKHFENAKPNGEEITTQEILLMSAKGLIETVTADEIIKRLDIIKKIEAMKDFETLSFEDSDFNYIKQLFTVCKWSTIHESIGDTLAQLKSAV